MHLEFRIIAVVWCVGDVGSPSWFWLRRQHEISQVYQLSSMHRCCCQVPLWASRFWAGSTCTLSKEHCRSQQFPNFTFSTVCKWAREIVFAALVEGSSLVPNIHMAAHNHPWPQSHQMHVLNSKGTMHINSDQANTHMHKIKSININKFLMQITYQKTCWCTAVLAGLQILASFRNQNCLCQCTLMIYRVRW